ncbi:glycosyltransferase family 4 protein [Sphingobacterium bovisgrunnientis]|uniref:glycosyltransferase family 4 protein n=1 Tax=Sphingobacterium bovisgrunnientis TaxID=1874697 RepID=UPI00135C199B|nr:glycosyltransferase family 4 protein [Sphingobacterium bovisgrunnientis]
MRGKKKVLVYGYFGFENNQLDGQTIKTRSIFELLEFYSREHPIVVNLFDTQKFKKSKLNLVKSFLQVSKSDVLFYIPAHNNLKYLFPIIYLICKIRGIDIHYIVVGGWLSDFIENLPIHQYMLKRVKGIYPQTKELTILLKEKYCFDNVVQLHNFRFSEKNRINLKDIQTPVKLVFMARVHPQKGVDTLFKLIDKLETNDVDYFSLDIYGPIYSDYNDTFNRQIEKSSGRIKYCGSVDPSNIPDVLSNYDLLLFPTEYYTEGFPGTILDAYLANVPVVVSKWKYACEFVEDGKTGLIANFDDSEDFLDKVIIILKNPEVINDFKNHISNYVDTFSPEKAWQILKNRI